MANSNQNRDIRFGGDATIFINEIPLANRQGGLAGRTAVKVATGATVLTTDDVLGGVVLQDPGTNTTLTTPTAAALVAALPGATVGTTFELHVRNTANGAETITFTGGTGVTVSGTATIAQNNAKTFKLVVTNASAGQEAITAYSMGTMVF